jgi:hypothetical protein
MDTGHVGNYNGDDNGLEILDGVEGVFKATENSGTEHQLTLMVLEPIEEKTVDILLRWRATP